MAEYLISPGKTLNTGMLTIDGVSVIDPCEMTWTLQDVSASDAGRDENVRMHKMRLGQIRKYQFAWNGVDPVNAAKLLDAVTRKEEFSCTMHDPLTNGMRTSLFYVGDRTSPLKQWIPSRVDGHVYAKVAFNLIEVMPTNPQVSVDTDQPVTAGKTLDTGMTFFDDVMVIDPSQVDPSYQDVSHKDAGRDDTLRMHKMRIGIVRKYVVGWNGIDPINAARILQLTNKEEFKARLIDPQTGEYVNGLYYSGDKTVKYQQWMPNRPDGKVYSSLSFDLIEVMPNSQNGEPAYDTCPIKTNTGTETGGAIVTT